MSDDELLKLDNQLCFALYSCSRALIRTYRPLLDELGITYPQYLVLMVLWEEDSRAVKELGDELYLDSGTLTPLLKRMEKSELIKRKRSKEDERKVYVHLTKKGKKLKAQAYKIPETMICHSGVTAEHYVALKNNLENLLESINTFQCDDAHNIAKLVCQYREKENN